MQESNYTYRFLNGDQLHYFINNGVLDLSGQPKIIRNAPDGWQQKSLQWERNKVDFGVIRAFTIPLKFVTDAAHILRSVFYQYGFEAVCTLVINELDPSTRQLKEIFRGDVDFTTFNDSDEFVTVNIIEGGLHKIVKANEATPYEIPVNVPSAINIKMDGTNIITKSKYFINNGGSSGEVNFDLRNHFVGLLDISTDTSNKIATRAVERVKFIGTNQDISGNENWFFYATVDSVLSLEWKFKVGAVVIPGGTLDPSGQTSIMFQVVRDGQVDVARSVSLFLGLLSGGGNVLEGNADINLLKGDFVYFRTFFTVIGSTGDAVIRYTYFDDLLEDSYLNVQGLFRNKTTIVKALRPNYTFLELTKKITDNKYLGQSDLLASQSKSEFCLTTLNALLGKPESAIIKTTLNDFYKFCHTRFSATKFVDDQNKLRIESIEQAFDNTIIFDIGPVRDLQVEMASDLLFNDLEAGYKTQTYDDVNGKYEFNALQKWKAIVTRVKTKLDLICPYRADPYGIEIAKANLNGTNTTDNQGDNDVFILNIENANSIQNILLSFVSSGNYIVFPSDPTIAIGAKFKITGTTNNNATYVVTAVDYLLTSQTVYTNIPITITEFTVNCQIEFIEGQTFKLKRPAYAPITGVPDNTVYNVECSPKRGILANKRLLRSMLWKLEPGYLWCQTGDKNKDLSTTLSGVTITEKQDIEIGSLGAPLFIPMLFKFEPKADVDIITVLNTNPRGKVAFQYNEKNYFGYIISINKQPATNSAQQWTLLAAPDNNLNNFIHG
ncbi:MAG TPA: hypothetical protein VF487_20285 [Chitinophagaceae bacterium]